jgi:DNA repair protein RAD16
VEELSNLRLQDATTKSLVFSQFVNFLDLIAYRLQKAGFVVSYSFYELPDILKANSTAARFAVWKGRCHPKLEMPPSNTSVRFTPFVCSDFTMDSPSSVNNIDVTVFLVSLKAGGVALNLTEASRVYLMDSWWNPAVSTLLALHASFLTNDFNCRLNIVCFVSSKDEPNLNLLTEAMDRIHRLGQRRPVQAIKLVVEDSIESRIVQVSFIPVLPDNRC